MRTLVNKNMSGPNPYGPIQYPDQQTLIYTGEVQIGDKSVWDILSRMPLHFASGYNKGASSFFMGAAIARDASGSGFRLASNAAAGTAAIGLAVLGAPGGQPEIVQLRGLFDLDDWTPVTGSKSLTALAYYYADSTSGRLITAAPTPPAFVNLVGQAISAQTMNITPGGGPSAFGPSYGEIYIENNAVALVITNQNQFYVITPGWTANATSGFTADTANNRLICNATNTYQITAVIDYAGPSNHTFEFAVFVNGIQQGHMTAHSQPRGAGQFICTTLAGLHALVAGDTIDVRADCDDAPGQSITVVHANLGITKVS